MAIQQKMTRWGAARLSRRLGRSVPFFGAMLATAAVVATVRRKGVLGGVLDTGLNAVPGIGLAKNALEVMRGRDFIPDRTGAGGPVAGRRSRSPVKA
jgi:hypothetical protein